MFDFVHILQEHGNGFQLVKRLFCVVSFNVAIGYSADHSLRFTWIILLVRGLFPFLEAPTRSPRFTGAHESLFLVHPALQTNPKDNPESFSLCT